MAGILQKIAGFLTYQEPKNDELGFELLEGGNEGMNEPPKKTAPNAGNQQEKQNGKESNGANPGEREERQNKSPFSRKTEKKENGGCNPPKDPENVSPRLCDNIATLKQKFSIPKNQDIVIRPFKIGRKYDACLCYIDGMVDKEMLNLSVLPSLMRKELVSEIDRECPLGYLASNVLSVNNVYSARKFTEVIKQILTGTAVLFIDGCDECAVLDTRGYEKRSVEQPVTEKVVMGSQEGFNEHLRTNIALIRRIIKNENLITEILPVGKAGNNSCAVMYHQEFANPKVVEEVKKRINRIDADFIPSDGILAQFIEDNPLTLFPQTLSTERPDRAASFIIEGQVIVIVEGTPFALTVPVTFFRLLHSSEDANVRWIYGTFLRIIRILGLFCATFLPGLYVAVILFHPEAIPTELLISIVTAKEPVPFPTIIELLILEGAFELIREGSLRIPTAIGQTLGIVGAIILGQAAVAAGLVSPIVVIIVSITALGSFTIPNYEFGIAVRIERFFFIFAGAVLGMYGITLMIFVLAVLACSMKSFGVPFFVPVAPKTKANPDVVVRRPVWRQKYRPDSIQSANRQRQGGNVTNWSKEKT